MCKPQGITSETVSLLLKLDLIPDSILHKCKVMCQSQRKTSETLTPLQKIFLVIDSSLYIYRETATVAPPYEFSNVVGV